MDLRRKVVVKKEGPLWKASMPYDDPSGISVCFREHSVALLVATSWANLMSRKTNEQGRA